MSYCRWSEGDLYAYRRSDGYAVHVAASSAGAGVVDFYLEPTAAALLARMLWLGSRGCHFPWDALRYLKEDIIEEVDQAELKRDGLSD